MIRVDGLGHYILCRACLVLAARATLLWFFPIVRLLAHNSLALASNKSERCEGVQEILTVFPPPPVAPPNAVQEEPAQVPLKQPKPVHERCEQLIPRQMPPGPQSGPEQPRLRQLSPKQCPLPPPPPPPPSQSEPIQPPFKQPKPSHIPFSQFGPMHPNGMQSVPVHSPSKQSLPEQPKLAQRSPRSCQQIYFR